MIKGLTTAAALMTTTCLTLAPAQAWAQEADASDTAPAAQADTAGVGDIVVTAQRREQRLQDVPVAVSVVGGETLA